MSKKRSGGAARVHAALMMATVLLGGASSALAQSGTVAGAVTSSVTGLPVPGGFVFLCSTATTGACTQITVNNTGTYATSAPVGSYVAFTLTSGFVDEISDDIPCPVRCGSDAARLLGTPFAITNGGKVLRNFALSPPGVLTGTVRDATTRAPVANHIVRVLSSFGTGIQQTATTTDAAGVFTFSTLGPATYRIHTENLQTPTYADEIFDDVPCIGLCDQVTATQSGSPLVVKSGASTTGVDILLDRSATISGTITHAPVVGTPRIDVDVYARVGSTLRLVASAGVTGSGAYAISGLPAGSYFLATVNDTFLDEVYNNRVCASRCQQDEIGRGDPVTVAAGGTAANIDFDLAHGGSVSGTITEAGTGTPLDAQVAVFRKVGLSVINEAATTASPSGAFTIRGLATGSYAVLAVRNTHVRELFGGLQCISCFQAEIVAATSVGVTTGLTTQGVNIVMDRAATISGTVRRAGSNAAIQNIPVQVFTAGASSAVAGAQTDAAGNYAIGRLIAGSYFVTTLSPDLANEVYNNVPCPGGTCSAAFAIANGSPVTVPAGGTANGIDFTLGAPSGLPGRPTSFAAASVPGGVRFTWRANAAGGSPTSFLFEAGLSPGTTFATLPVGTNELVVPGVPPGTYFLRVRGVNASGTGEASTEFTLRVGASGTVAPNAPSFLETVVIAGRLTATWRAPTSGPAPSSYLLEVGTAAGLSNVAVVPVAVPLFQFSGVPAGYYFMRVRGVTSGAAGPPTADVMLVVGNVPAPPTQPQSFSSRVSGGTVTLAWFAPTFGPATSYVLEAGTAPGLSNIVVFNTGSANTSLVVPGVPPGTYHVRLRAVNAQGSSPPTGDFTLVVP